MPRIQHASLLAGTLIGVGVLIAVWMSCLQLPYVDQNFSYSADLQTTTSTYSEADGRYSGQRYASTVYNIQPLSTPHNEDAVLQSSTTTTRHSDNTTHTVANQYAVDAMAGVLRAKQNQPIYIFAPRNIAKGETFSYWAASYRTAVIMHYVTSETIRGLPVYSYLGSVTTDNSVTGQAADQTQRTKLDIRIWIEPTTGWLIKALTSSTVYQIDPQTGKTLNPLTSSVSDFSQESVRQHVAYAKQLKNRLNFGLQVVPSILLLMGLVLFGAALLKIGKVRSVPVRATIIATLAITIANLVGWITDIKPLIVLTPGSSAINPVASLCFATVAVCIFLLYRKQRYRLVTIMGACVSLVALLAALGIAGIIPLQIDRILFKSQLAALDTSGYMSMFGCLTLFILGSAVIKAAHKQTRATAKLTAGMVIVLGCAGLLAKLLILDKFFVNSSIASLAISGSVLAILSGASLLTILLRQEPHETRQPFFLALLKPALVTMPLILIGIPAQLQQNVVNQKVENAFEKQTTITQSAVEKSVDVQTNTLIGAKALFAASQYVERSEWHSYISALDLPKNAPGVQSVGYAEITSASQVDALAKRVQAQGYTFKIVPAGTRSSYTPIVYVEPLTNESKHLIGYDLAADSDRLAAMQQASTTRKPTISAKTSLLQETNSNTASGFLLFTPVYSNSDSTKLLGYVYATFDAQTFFANIAKSQDPNLTMTIYDGFNTTSGALLYGEPTIPTSDQHVKLQTIYADGHPWTLQFTAKDTYGLASSEAFTPGLILLGGGITYLIGLTVILWIRSHNYKLPTSSSGLYSL